MNADITPMNADDSLAKVVLASGIDDIRDRRNGAYPTLDDFRDRRNGAFPTLKGLSAFIGVISAFIGVPKKFARITPSLPHNPPRHTYLISRKSSIPYFDPSRPRPDCFTPPKGATSLEKMPVFTPTMPVSSASDTRMTRPTSRE